VADADEGGRQSRRGRGSFRAAHDAEHDGCTCGVVDASGEQAGLPRCTREPRGAVERVGDDDARLPFGSLYPDERGAVRIKGPAFGATGALRGCDWLFCQDGKLRPVGPGSFPLAHAAPARVGRLRGYGNALDAEAATQFIAAYMEI
jgi:DNA (cytosine-5)-methyltransferase 1